MSNYTETVKSRIEPDLKAELKLLSEETGISMSETIREAISTYVNRREDIMEYQENMEVDSLEAKNFVNNIFENYLDEITASETQAKAIIYLRQSIKNNDYSARYKRMAKTLTVLAKNMGFKAEEIETQFYQNLSGFWSYEEVLKFLMADSVQAIYISEITRLSRNIEAYLTIINYAYKNHKQIFLNSTDITSGSGYLSGLIQAIFAEMELLSKQTSFSNYMLEVAQFLNKSIRFEEMKDKKARKLVILAKYTDREQFILKMIDKAVDVLESEKSSDQLKEVAQSVLDEFDN